MPPKPNTTPHTPELSSTPPGVAAAVPASRQTMMEAVNEGIEAEDLAVLLQEQDKERLKDCLMKIRQNALGMASEIEKYLGLRPSRSQITEKSSRSP